MKWLFLVIFVSTPLHAEEWTKTDYALLGGAMTLLVVDWGQTRAITNETVTYASLNGQAPVAVSSKRSYHEKNPLLGENPSRSEVDRYFLVAVLGTAGLAYVLPPTYRRWFLGGVIVLEAYSVINNHRIGLRMDF